MLKKRNVKVNVKNVVKHSINIRNCKKVLFEGSIAHRKMIWFQSDYHQIYTKDVNKVALSVN